MVPLCAARVQNLKTGDFVVIKCGAFGHTAEIPPSGFLRQLGLQPTARVLDLEPRLRCRLCHARRQAVVSVDGKRQPGAVSQAGAGRIWGHHTIRQKSYAKPKTKQIQWHSQMSVCEWISAEREILRLSLSKSPFRTVPKGKGDLKGFLTYDF
jgi:hypothetical protein